MTRPIRPTRCRPCATPKDPKRRRTGRATTVSNKREKKNEDTKYIKRQENKAQIQVPPRGRPGSRHQVSIKPERGHGRESLQSAYIRSHKNGSTSKSSSTNTSSSSSNFKTPSSYTHTHTQTNEHTHTHREKPIKHRPGCVDFYDLLSIDLCLSHRSRQTTDRADCHQADRIPIQHYSIRSVKSVKKKKRKAAPLAPLETPKNGPWRCPRLISTGTTCVTTFFIYIYIYILIHF